MKPLEGDKIRVGVTEEGHLHPVEFYIERGWMAPMHVAPWAGEDLDDDVPPVLRVLRGDFFCAPFGDSDLTPEETRPHGATANGPWHKISSSERHIELELDQKIMGATVRKRIGIEPGHAVVYQQHDFIGGSGSLPLGHHAMLRVPERVYLGFSPWLWGGTPPGPVETDPEKGRSLLVYPQRFDDLKKVRLADGGTVDLTRYPVLEKHEDLLMLIADSNLPFSWSAVTAPGAGWVWFSLKSPRVLRNTVLWLSHGGRRYSPFLSRHTHVIGVEEVTSYFHLGHGASVSENPLSAQGYSTALELTPEATLSIRYAFGLAAVPWEFGRVTSITPTPGGVIIKDEAGVEVFAAIDVGFVVEDEIGHA